MPVLATVDSFGYKLLFLLHIVAIVVGFAPAFVNPVINARLKRSQRTLADHRDVAQVMATNSQQVYGPALVLAGVFGLGMIGLSDKTYEFSQSWVAIALVLWFVLLGVVFALLVPAERGVGSGDRAAEAKVTMFGGMVHLVFLLLVIDMIWKPGT